MEKDWYKHLKDAIYLFNTGQQFACDRFFGNHFVHKNENACCRFVVWAPNARRVAIMGDFNHWQPQNMTTYDDTGVWGIELAQVKQGDCYKYEIEDQFGHCTYKIDPYAKKYELPPKDSSVVYEPEPKKWKDTLWYVNGRRRDILEKPMNIYEVHLSSWKKHPDGTFYSFDELSTTLIPYVKDMGYTHIELMPLMAHPLDASWGYQVTGFYAVASQYGDIDGLRRFVEAAHRQHIGVIMDWVPGHFCRNENALAYFDGTPTYEYADQNKADNRGWGTLNFDLGKNQVRSFLISNALFWLEHCHLDGLRVDAVSNMLYLDFDNVHWLPNKYGDNRNLEGIAFLQQLNKVVYSRLPHVVMIAEESTAYDGITRPVHSGGLGFHFKWNMGWMNDTLKYIEMTPQERQEHYRLMTFSFMYAFNEQYILPLSHDEVVHGKNSLLGKTKGDRYNQFAMLRTLQAYLMAHPGKKLNFMGYELGQFLEWRYYSELEWIDLTRPFNSEYQAFIQYLNQLYKALPALYEKDHQPNGLSILDADNMEQHIISFIRHGNKARDLLLTIANFMPNEQQHYRIGVPYRGEYEVVLNTEAVEFGGTWQFTRQVFKAEKVPYQNQPYSIVCVVPSLSVLYIKPKRIYINQIGE